MKKILDRLSRIGLHKKRYAYHSTFVAFAFFFVIGSIFSYNSSFVYAATYNFVQSTWSGGADTLSVAVHASNQSNWDRFYSSTGMDTSSGLRLAAVHKTVVDDGAGLTFVPPVVDASVPSVSVAVAPDGTSFYAVTFDSSQNSFINEYSRNLTTGAITPLPTPKIPSGLGYQIVVSPDGKSVYVPGASDGDIYQYSRDISTGELTALPVPTIALGVPIMGVSISPDGASVYVSASDNDVIYQFSRDPGTGELTPLATPTVASGGVMPLGMAFSPDGTSMYVANSRSGSVSEFSRDPGTGELTPLATPTVASGATPYGVIVSPDGTSVYATNAGEGTVSEYSRDLNTGELTPLGTPTAQAGSNPFAMAMTPDGTELFVANITGSRSISQFVRDPSTGELTPISPTVSLSTNPYGIAISPDGSSVYLPSISGGGISQYSRSSGVSTGAAPGFELGTRSSTGIIGVGEAASIELRQKGGLTALSPDSVAVGSGALKIVVSPDGTSAYVNTTDENSIYQYSRNPGTGALTALSSPTVGTDEPTEGIVISPDGASVYAIGLNLITEYSRDPGTGLLTQFGTFSGITGQDLGMGAISPDGTSVYVVGSGNLFELSRDQITGELSSLPVPSVGVGQSAFGITVSPDNASVYATNPNDGYVYEYSRDQITGELTALGTIATGGEPYEIVVSPDGSSVYTAAPTGYPGYGNLGGEIFEYVRDTGTGILTAAATPMIAGGAFTVGIAISPDGASVYATNYYYGYYGFYGAAAGDGVSQYSRDVNTGNLTPLSAEPVATGQYPFGIAVSPDGNSVYAVSQNNIVRQYSRNTVAATFGTFTSASINLGAGAAFDTLSWTETLNDQSITMRARSSSNPTFSGAPDWSSCADIGNGSVLSSGGCVTDGDRYVQYQATLTSATQLATPTLDSVTIRFTQYGNAGTGSLISSIYDSGDPATLVANMRWTETGTSSTETVKFQVRSASSAAGIASAPWCGPSVTCDGSSYFTGSSGSVILPSNHPLRSGGDDEFFQYRVLLSSNGITTPAVTSATIQYVVNAAPQFDATYGTNGVTVSQDSVASTDPGAVAISYSVRDPDTALGSVTPGFITPSFEYNLGNGWVAIPVNDLAVHDTGNKAVDGTNHTTYTATWAASSTIPNTVHASVQVRVTVNDNEPANNTAQAISDPFALDTKAPITSAMIDSSNSSTITFSAADDVQLQYRFCNDATFPTTDTEGNSCDWSAFGGTIASSSIAWLPLKDSSGSAAVYLQAQDTFGNIVTKKLVTPSILTHFDLKDVSDPANDIYKEFISWSPFVASSSNSFAAYMLYNSTDGSTYSLLATITNPNQNYYAHTVTSSTTPEYYKAVSVNTQGNTSDYTQVLTNTPGQGGSGGPDVTPPYIDPANILVPSVTLRNTSALVTFTTDELAQGTVQYIIVDADMAWTTVASPSYALAHSVYLQGLQPNTAYHLRVKSIDAAGNESAYVDGPDFTTVGGPVTSNVSTINLTDNSTTITWNTSTSSDSYVYYSENQDMSGAIMKGSAVAVSCVDTVCQHKVDLTGLMPATSYYYYVQSTDGLGDTSVDNNAGLEYTFHTTLDITPPVIIILGTPVVSSDSAVLVWRTDKPATSQVMWGPVSGHLARTTILDPTKTIVHAVTLSASTFDTNNAAQGLMAQTPYYYQVTSIDAAGNNASSTEQTFTTTQTGQVTIVSGGGGGGGSCSVPTAAASSPTSTIPPIITTLTANNTGAFSGDVKIETDKDVIAFVQYGDSTSYGSTEADGTLSSSKIIPLTKLQQGTTYHYKVMVIDKYFNKTASEDKTFTTGYASEPVANKVTLTTAVDVQDKLEQLIESALPSLSPPFMTTPEVGSTTEQSTAVSWVTNIKANGSIRYATDAEYAANKNDYVTEVSGGQALDMNHSIVLPNLKSNTLYHIQVRSYVFPQLVGKTTDATFYTKASPVVPSIVGVKNNGFTVVWQTDEPTTSIVDYRDLKTGKSIRLTDVALKTYHNVQIQNLPAGARYSVTVSGLNSKGNAVESAKSLTVVTSIDVTPPKISSFKVDNAILPGRTGFIQTVVGWMTDEPANSVVHYQEGAGTMGTTTLKVGSPDTYSTSHVVIIPNLRAATVYSIKVTSTDQSGNTKVFGPTSIITPNQTQSILDIIVKNFEDTFKFLGAK